MARMVIRCQHTGHYVLTGMETRPDSIVVGGRIYCPYCEADHVWTCNDARPEVISQMPRKPIVRQAS